MMVLVTGASGFVGQEIVRRLSRDRSVRVVAAVRERSVGWLPRVETKRMPNLDSRADFSTLLHGISTVVHSAARAHVVHERSVDPLAEFRRINVEGTVTLARQAAEAGVRRFVFLSSIKVNGNHTQRGVPYQADDSPQPEDAYGLSKFEAEAQLRSLALASAMEVVIVRPVLSYGPGVRANFRSLLRIMNMWMPLPLPFGAVNNRRSLVAVENLADLVAQCVRHKAAANKTFLVSDGEDLSTPELLCRIAHLLGRRTWLIPVAPDALRIGLRAIGAGGIYSQLCGSLQVDIAKTREVLGWSPIVSLDVALANTVRAYLEVG